MENDYESREGGCQLWLAQVTTEANKGKTPLFLKGGSYIILALIEIDASFRLWHYIPLVSYLAAVLSRFIRVMSFQCI